jgi:hypothetical protein
LQWGEQNAHLKPGALSPPRLNASHPRAFYHRTAVRHMGAKGRDRDLAVLPFLGRTRSFFKVNGHTALTDGQVNKHLFANLTRSGFSDGMHFWRREAIVP